MSEYSNVIITFVVTLEIIVRFIRPTNVYQWVTTHNNKVLHRGGQKIYNQVHERINPIQLRFYYKRYKDCNNRCSRCATYKTLYVNNNNNNVDILTPVNNCKQHQKTMKP